jgi:hypothetical protein
VLEVSFIAIFKDVKV